jgi:hypothetical protein
MCSGRMPLFSFSDFFLVVFGQLCFVRVPRFFSLPGMASATFF